MSAQSLIIIKIGNAVVATVTATLLPQVYTDYFCAFGVAELLPNGHTGKLAAAGCPRSRDELEYLAKQGINQLVTLSRERRPPIESLPNGMNWTEIPVEEFEPPTVGEIQIFINLCQQGELNGDVTCVHCRQGLGRTGVMLACYLVKFQDLAPERAVMNVRIMRPGSVETYGQERAVVRYHDFLRGFASD